VKLALHNHCIELASSKVEALEQELNATRESATTESKSSAGDKHETGRAMMHLEQEKLHKQLAEAQTIVAELERIDGKAVHTQIGLGTLVKTDKATFLLAAGLGKVDFEGITYFVVSTKAPIAAQFLGKTTGDKVNMNGTVYDIQLVQ
jgi:transcription elongation GreA/GreB family factor